MAYTLGIVLFALGILFSVCLHEAGHMGTAKAFGMKVTKYFAGFGPTLWSFRRGETEYGVKAIPAGGFVKIVGMTPLDDDVDPADEPRAFWRKPLWQRTVVLAAGSVTHFILGFLLLLACALWVGLPNPALADYDVDKGPAVIGSISDCVQTKYDENNDAGTKCDSDDPVAPARAAGLEPGDKITAFDGKPVENYGALVKTIRAAEPGETVPVTFQRGDQTRQANVTLVKTERRVGGSPEKPKLEKVPVLGITPALPDLPTTVTYGPGEAVGQAGNLTGQLFTGTFGAIQKFPEKVPKLIDALTGAERDNETPISVVGASRLGGEAAEGGFWPIFVFLLASLNVFIGIFNLLPLLPLDGGHIAIAWFERIRSWFAAKLGRPDPGRVDYAKLMPVTYAVILVFGSISLLAIATDIVNPITLPTP